MTDYIEYTVRYYEDRTEWRLKNKLHHPTEPAIVWKNGTVEHYRYGKLHRVGGPAIIDQHGNQEYHYEGKRHRDDGPAVIWASGKKSFYREGKRIDERLFQIKS